MSNKDDSAFANLKVTQFPVSGGEYFQHLTQGAFSWQALPSLTSPQVFATSPIHLTKNKKCMPLNLNLHSFLDSWKEHLTFNDSNTYPYSDNIRHVSLKFISYSHNTDTGTFYSSPNTRDVECVYMHTVLWITLSLISTWSLANIS